MEKQSEVSVGKKEYDKLVDFIPSVLSYVETFEKFCLIIDECTVENERSEIDLIKCGFSSNTKKKLFSLYLYCIGADINLKKMDQKFPFRGPIGYGNSCMDYFFANSKIFRLQAVLNDATGSVKSTSHKGPGYCYVLDRFPSSCFLGQVTELFFCLYVEFFSSSVYALFDC